MAEAQDPAKDAIRDSIAKTLLPLEGIDCLKPEQSAVLEHFLSGNDAMGLLPTGFGKSLIYQIAPAASGLLSFSAHCPKHIQTAKYPILIVLSPLMALIKDQVVEAQQFGLSAVSLCNASPCDERRILDGGFQLMFGNPETFVLDPKWRDMLQSTVFQENLVGIVVDEAHKTPNWGEAKKGGKAFRETFGRIAELRSLCKQGTPILALTASADPQTRKDIVRLLNMSKDTKFVEGCPNRINIRLSANRIKPTDNLSCLHWIVSGVKENPTEFGKVLIYCKEFDKCGAVWCHLKAALGDQAYVGKKVYYNCRIQVFHSQSPPELKEHILHSFRKNSSVLSIVIATTALSMGINFPNVRYVVNYGPPEDMEDMLQQIGRAGRDGAPSHAIMYSYAQQRCSKDVREYAKGLKCLRTLLYNKFESVPTTVPLEPGHACCNFCHSSCSCDSASMSCSVSAYAFEQLTPNVVKTSPSLLRSVSDEQRELLREGLYHYRHSIVKDKRLMLSVAQTTGLSPDFIDAVVDDCEYIFSVDYIQENFNVLSPKYAEGIMQIVNKVFHDNLDLDDLFDAISDELSNDMEPSGDNHMPPASWVSLETPPEGVLVFPYDNENYDSDSD
ncbi:putative ATP-dependent DNA helicase RecS [Branchiostoma floridae x Branchiostoma japonicum]